jgi:heterodisulfide reductase subunit A-like polyferredoxin
MEQGLTKKTGAVLVQGGGIAGVQASLDLANSGFRVYLVERSAAIGGMMSKLDKTFPTGDCATCIVSPKLVECARNLNIEIFTLSELVKIDGEPGHFTATIKRYPRYVNETICNDCGDCYGVCPVEIKDAFNRDINRRKAIAKHAAQAIPNVAEILKLGHAPCKTACPAGINVQGYIQLIKKKEYVKAVNLIRERNPLSAVCGRVCHHPCETSCTRGKVDSDVAIRQLKRFASDREMEMVTSGEISLPEERVPSPGAGRVAVVGAGPAGITAAQDLADRGYAVTVYEAQPAAGGMLRWGIPEYRLPEQVLDYEIELVRRKGVSFVFNCNVGEDISLEKIRKECDALFLSVGFRKSRKLGVEGEDNSGVIHGIEFLRQASTKGDLPEVGENVIVIGGGNVAVDVARTALRLGAASVEMVSLEQLHEMPAFPEEIDATLKEGIKILNGWGPCRILGNGTTEGIELKRCTCVFDEEGCFSPTYDENNRMLIEADQIIIAIGQELDVRFIERTNIEIERGCFKVDPVTLETSEEGIFAGGDVVTGPATVIDAVAAGKRAAESIDLYLRGEEKEGVRFEKTIKPVPEEQLPSIDGIEKRERAVAEELPVEQRISGFDEVERGFSEEDAIAECERCLNCALCAECGECVRACEKNAIDHHMQEKTIELNIGSVILAPGFEEFPAEEKGGFGFGRCPDVITSVQFERMLSAAGPTEGHLVRLSDGHAASRIAFIQCVGSRDITCGNEYCSSVCCMAAIKQAVVAREHQDGVEVTIFYIDVRAFGKDFDQYYERARNENGIRFVRGIPSVIFQTPPKEELRLRYVDAQFELREEEFDLVVLSVGIYPRDTVSESISRLGVELNDFGFCATDRLNPLVTSRPGVFVAGAFQEPKDIPETVTQASAAASMSMELLAEARHSLVTKRIYPPEREIIDEEPRIGVFVCHCGINIASVVDVEKVTEAVKREPGVVMASHTMYTCSDASLSEIKDKILEHRLNRVVVASCTPRTHEDLFRDTLREAGLNPFLFELANIRDQCSWVHSSEPDSATRKAIELVCMSIARARLLFPHVGELLEIDQSGLVVGGGLSGMTAALSLADQGFGVHLIERESFLGGNLLNIHRTLEHDCISGFISDIIERVENHPNISLYTKAEIAAVSGHVGNFRLALTSGGENFNVTCGAIIIATGAGRAETSEYLYSESENVITQIELERRLHENEFDGNDKNIVMIQCVGSRSDERPYCSRICCSMAIKNALSIKEKHPGANVYILYRDVRTYGFRETYYRKARRAGVVFIRYDENDPPRVSNNSGLIVRIKSPDMPVAIEIAADHLILSTGIAAHDNHQLADMLKVPLNDDGFYVEAHLKLRPVDFANEGIFLCGLAHSPKFIDENISQARAAAARAATVLSKTHLDVGAQVARVDQNKCISCMTCVNACPYNAPFVNVDHKAEISPAKCMGCGICASECPAHAIRINHFESRQFDAILDSLFHFDEYEAENKVKIISKSGVKK